MCPGLTGLSRSVLKEEIHHKPAKEHTNKDSAPPWDGQFHNFLGSFSGFMSDAAEFGFGL